MTVFTHKDRVYFWDRKENCDQQGISLTELLLLFKIKQFSDLKDISSAYDDFEYWDRRVRAIVHSFVEFPINFLDDDPWRCVPRVVSENYNEFREQVLIDSIEWVESLIDDEAALKKLLHFFENFPRVIEKMDYSIKTESGSEDISLSYAENFRFKSESGYFNLFTLPKDVRNIIVPNDNNSVIFAADFRQFEFRTFLKLQGLDHFLKVENIYEELAKELKIDGDPKISIISYLYNNKDNYVFESFFRKKELLSRIDNQNVFWSSDGPVYVPPHHEDKKKLHTIIQTVSQYVYLKKLDEIFGVLYNKRSKFIFPLHDSIIISLDRDEPEVLSDIMNIMEDEHYKIKCYIGENYRDAEEV